MDIKEYFREEGRLEGRREGIKQGMQKERQQVVLNMLKKKLDTSLISEVTGLSEKEVRSFKNRS